MEIQRKLRRAGAEAARSKRGRYWRSDFTRLTELEQETREKFDRTLAALGFMSQRAVAVGTRRLDLCERFRCGNTEAVADVCVVGDLAQRGHRSLGGGADTAQRLHSGEACGAVAALQHVE